jgi:hypothetical protein
VSHTGLEAGISKFIKTFEFTTLYALLPRMSIGIAERLCVGEVRGGLGRILTAREEIIRLVDLCRLRDRFPVLCSSLLEKTRIRHNEGSVPGIFNFIVGRTHLQPENFQSFGDLHVSYSRKKGALKSRGSGTPLAPIAAVLSCVDISLFQLKSDLKK